MLRRVLPLLLLLCFAQTLFAQYRISGVVKDQKAQLPLSGATVRLSSVADRNFSRSALSDSLGGFLFQNLPADSFQLSVSFVGFKDLSKGIRVSASRSTTDSAAEISISVALVPNASNALATVVVTARRPAVVQKADTVQMDASQYKVNPDASTEDLVKKMPGITVENGQVKAQGETVQKVTIDGRDLFGDDATAALRNLPAEIVDKIQVFDRLSDQAQFTGFDDGSATKSINIVTKAAMRNGQFGRVFAGYGTDGRYWAGGNTTLLKNNRRISIVGTFNNVNQQNFSQQDLLGVTANAQRGGGMRGGGNFGGGRGQGGGMNGGFGNSSNFLVGSQGGINKTHSFGINYSDIIGKKLTLTGSYFFNNTGNTTSSVSNQQFFSASAPNLNQNAFSTSNNNNHRLNLRLEYRFDSANQLIITPSLSFQANNADQNVVTASLAKSGRLISRINNENNSNRNGNNLNNTILFRHAFAKRGRTFSINLNTSGNDRTGNVWVDALQSRYDSLGTQRDSLQRRYTDQANKGYQLSANLVYTEPVGAHGQLQVNYNPSYSNSKADQQSFLYDNAEGKYSRFDTTLSNRFNNVTRTQNAGIAYRYGNRDNQLSIGANYQYNTLLSDQAFPRELHVNKSFSNILPNAILRWKISSRSSLRFFYRASTANPSVTQLSDVYDLTNLPYITGGNPDLKQQYTHTLNGRYTYTNTGKSILFVGNIFYQTAAGYITNATFIPLHDSVINSKLTLLRGQQLTVPVNLDGYHSFRSFVTLAVPVHFIKSNLNLNGGMTLAKLPGIVQGEGGQSLNTTYTGGAVIGSNISPNVDFTVSYTANFSTVHNTYKASVDDNYLQQIAGVQLNLLSKTGWFLQNEVNAQFYSGLSAGFNQRYTLWNAAAGKKFLKNQKGELKLSVFDLLRQNQSISRNVTETYVADVQTQVLRQYFMLTFTYNLRNFGTAAARPFNREGRGVRNWGDGPRF